VDIEPDTYTYIASSVSIINNDYQPHRPPGFPLLIVPLLLLTGNGPLSAKLTSFILGILLIVLSYYIFTQASLKIHGKTEKNIKKSKYIGLLVSCLIALNLYFIINNARGLREESMGILLLLIFFFFIVKRGISIWNNILLALSISLLTLIHLTAGLFITIGIVFFFLISKLHIFKLNFKSNSISTNQFFIVLFSFVLSFFFWAFFCSNKYGEPFYILTHHNTVFEGKYGISLSTLDNILKALLNALIFGIPSEFIYLGILISFTFILLIFYIVIKNIRNKQIFFIFSVISINFAYLSIFMTIPRIIFYFFPYIFYLGIIPVGNIIANPNQGNRKVKKRMKLLLLIFIISYFIQGIDNLSLIYYFYQIYHVVPCFCNLNTIAAQFYQPLTIFRVIFNSILFIAIEGCLLLFLFKAKNLRINFWDIQKSPERSQFKKNKKIND
jgi:hypothetical protein